MKIDIRILVLLMVVELCIPLQSNASITGSVTDTESNPISGALVTFTDESNPYRSFIAYTDETGYYEIDLPTVAVEEKAPTPFTLGQNYPNPFNPATTIPFTLDTSSHVTLTIYNIMGQRVRSLLNAYMHAGLHNVIWDGMDDHGNYVSASVYVYQLGNGGNVDSKKMLLLDGGSFRQTYHSGNIGKITTITETVLYHVSIKAFGFVEHTVSGVQLNDGTSYNCELSTMMRIYDIPFVSIPGGTFQMGGEESSYEKPAHTVTVSSFEMSTYEITNAQYAQFLNSLLVSGKIELSDGRVYAKGGPWSGQMYLEYSEEWDYLSQCWINYNIGGFSVPSGYEDWPVVYVTWYGAKAFAEHYGFDLPREAEWEYASRWGNHQYEYGTIDGTINISNANYNGNIFHPIAVGSYSANPFGLHDMSGNIREWCSDWFGSYTSESQTDPTGAQTGTERVCRGGGWRDAYDSCRSAYRIRVYPTEANMLLGFRVVRRSAQQ